MSRAAIVDTGPLVAFHVEEHVPAIHTLHRKYRDRPMSLADACIVRMVELFEQHQVMTLDSDFSVYRKYGREPIDLIQPRSAQ